MELASYDRFSQLPPTCQGRHRHHGSRYVHGAERHRPAVQSRLAHADAAGAGRAGRSGRRPRRCVAARGPAVETIKLEAELDATDQLEFPNKFPLAVLLGLQPQLAQLEMLVNPTVETLQADDAMANAGTLEIIPLEQPLTLFVWSSSRVVPVRLTDFSITEEAFDVQLNPIRAKVSLGLRVLNVDDLGFAHPGGRMFMTYLSNKQNLASRATSAAISVLGLGGI